MSSMLTPIQAGEYLNKSVSTLSVWRCFKKGPPYVKVGHSVRYQQEALDDFIRKNTVNFETVQQSTTGVEG